MPIRIGIDVGGTKIEGIALDGSDEIARARIDTPREDYVATLEAIVGLIAMLEHRVRRNSSPESGHATVGIGIPGALAPDTGLVKNANSTWMIGRPLRQDLEARLARPVRIANDANCLAMSEAADGAGAGADVVFAVIVGTGTGAGIVVRRTLLTGPNAIAGEWGHNPLPWPESDEMPGPPCYCGRRGCIETYLSGPGMIAEHERRTSERLLPPDIISRAAGGDREAALTLTRYERRMARALAAIINVLDPDVIVLGGGMSNIQRLYANIPRLWGAFVFSCGASPGNTPGGLEGMEPKHSNVVRTRLVPARHGDASGVRGAAWLWSRPPNSQAGP